MAQSAVEAALAHLESHVDDTKARLAELVRPLVARLSRNMDSGIDLRIGSAAYPQDGDEAQALLAAAAGRAR